MVYELDGSESNDNYSTIRKMCLSIQWGINCHQWSIVDWNLAVQNQSKPLLTITPIDGKIWRPTMINGMLLTDCVPPMMRFFQYPMVSLSLCCALLFLLMFFVIPCSVKHYWLEYTKLYTINVIPGYQPFSGQCMNHHYYQPLLSTMIINHDCP